MAVDTCEQRPEVFTGSGLREALALGSNMKSHGLGFLVCKMGIVAIS